VLRAHAGVLEVAFFLDLLRRYHSAEQAEAGLDTAIDWARFEEFSEHAAQTSGLTRPLCVPVARWSGYGDRDS